MLKGKGSLYILFPAVIFIWGAIIYKVVATFGDDTPLHPQITVEKMISVKGVVKDTFSLLPIERDPFLGHYYKKPKIQKSGAENAKKSVTWPEIQYLGVVSGAGKTTMVYILLVNGKQVLLEKGDSAQGISIFTGSQSKIKLQYKEDSRVYIKTG